MRCLLFTSVLGQGTTHGSRDLSSGCQWVTLSGYFGSLVASPYAWETRGWLVGACSLCRVLAALCVVIVIYSIVGWFV